MRFGSMNESLNSYVLTHCILSTVIYNSQRENAPIFMVPTFWKFPMQFLLLVHHFLSASIIEGA